MEDLRKRLFDKSWNFKNRDQIINKLENTEYDILIIGGGITGAGAAREATMRGLKVGLVEMQDFSSGTSSRSSKLAHGGLRYLAYGEMDLVKEATTERNWMRHHISHLVRPVPIWWVNWKEENTRKTVIKRALIVYDMLSNKDQEYKNFKEFEWFPTEELEKIEPELKGKVNKGGALYYDTNVDDARLTIETIKEAVIRGADAVNYCKVTGYIKENGRIIGVKCTDVEYNKDFKIKAKLVINSTGIWTDQLLENYPKDIPNPMIRPTKGIHLIFRRQNIKNNNALIIPSKFDTRGFFLLPRGDFDIIGTTDTDYSGDLANPYCNKEDTDYLLQSLQECFPNAKLGYDNIVATYAGIRPLVMQEGKPESDISRNHTIFYSDDGLLTIAGGKLTTMRKMAEDSFVKIEEKNIFPDIGREANFSKQKYYISIDKDIWMNELEKSGITLDIKVADYMYQQYGRGALEILEIIKNNDSLQEKIIDENIFIKAEIVYSLKHELTTHLGDIFCRRTEMSLYIHHKRQLEAAQKVADLMGEEYSWSDEKKKEEIKLYMDYIKNTVAFLS
ncbi:MAG: glycerol-3-phosphate dehydrogenase/oxidase [archaeon]|nr:glycerol-3-phosphate dehydrogenase/oxidase [archaeon]